MDDKKEIYWKHLNYIFVLFLLLYSGFKLCGGILLIYLIKSDPEVGNIISWIGVVFLCMGTIEMLVSTLISNLRNIKPIIQLFIIGLMLLVIMILYETNLIGHIPNQYKAGAKELIEAISFGIISILFLFKLKAKS
jgi:hypothetical protein